MRYLKIIKLSLAGRNNTGRIRSKSKGKKKKHFYRIINYKRIIVLFFPSIVLKIEKNSKRNNLVALISYLNGLFFYILCPKELYVGDILFDRNLFLFKTGNFYKIGDLPNGTMINSIELKETMGSVFTRAGGCGGKIVKKDVKHSYVKLSSKLIYKLYNENACTIGILDLNENVMKKKEKAGKNILFGKKPYVHGVSRNPVDHPNGGRTHGGKVFRNIWGKIAKGGKKKKRNVNVFTYV